MKNLSIKFRSLTEAEWKYTYAQSMQLESQTGCIGHLRGDFGPDGDEFYTTWFGSHSRQWYSEGFERELDRVIKTLHLDPLKSRNGMEKYISESGYGEYAIKRMDTDHGTEYGLRVETESYAYLIRLIPAKWDYDFYVYCYVKKWLDRNIDRATEGIRFIDSSYKELFRIPDGGKIMLTSAWGEKTEHTCRYIDGSHVEIGHDLFHICEFAERMERNGATYAPLP